MPSKRPLLLALALLAACSDGDDGRDAAPTTVPAGGCPVAADVVAEAVAHRVAVDREVSSDRSCTYLAEGDAVAGGRVEVVLRSLADDGFGAVLADVEREAGPTIVLPDGLVDGAERGWIAVVGRAVQLGAANDETLVVVAVADPLLDADAAQEVAADLAEAALGR